MPIFRKRTQNQHFIVRFLQTACKFHHSQEAGQQKLAKKSRRPFASNTLCSKLLMLEIGTFLIDNLLRSAQQQKFFLMGLHDGIVFRNSKSGLPAKLFSR